MKTILSLLAVIIVVSSLRPATAGDLVVSRTMLLDPTNALTIADVVRQEGAPIGPTLASRSAHSTAWIRLKVRAPRHGGAVVLYVTPPFINEIRLYEAGLGDPMRWRTRATGSLLPFSSRDRARTSLGFVVRPSAPEGTYYLRVRTRSLLAMDVKALTPEDADRRDHQRDLTIMFFATAMGCLWIWAIHSYLLERQPVLGAFALHQAVYALFGVVAAGYLAPWLPAGYMWVQDRTSAVLYLGISFTGALFCRETFKPYDPPPRLMRGIQLLLIAFPILLLVMAAGHNEWAINGNALLIKLAWPYFAYLSFSLRRESRPRRRTLRAVFSSILAINVAFWLAPHIGWLAARVNLGPMQVLVLDGLVIGGLFALTSHARARQAVREAQQAVQDLLLAQKQIEIERDLKRQIEVQARTDHLTGLCNRRRCFELAEAELARAVRFGRPYTLLAIDFDRFKSINDTWGHGVGDVVLRTGSLLIRGALRDEDILGRTGGEEFTAVLVETDGESAVAAARRICAVVAGAEITAPDAGRILVSVSIGVAHLDGRNVPLDVLLHEADAAMYQAKHEGRDRVVVHREMVADRGGREPVVGCQMPLIRDLVDLQH